MTLGIVNVLPALTAQSPWLVKDSLPGKVEKILKGSLDLIPSPSHSVKIQIIEGKVYLR